MKDYKLGKVMGLDISAEPIAMVGSILLFVLMMGIAVSVLKLPILEAMAGSLLAVILHWVSDMVHHLGHAWAARKTGYPMTGIRLGKWGLLATSLYPLDEPILPRSVHIRRALGGPVVSLLFTLLIALIVVILRTVDSPLWWVGVFLFLDNLIVFTLGAFLPLGFTDGSTLLHWWRER